MAYFSSNIYTLKQKILNFSNKISRFLPKPNRKFTADMTYGTPIRQFSPHFLALDSFAHLYIGYNC